MEAIKHKIEIMKLPEKATSGPMLKEEMNSGNIYRFLGPKGLSDLMFL